MSARRRLPVPAGIVADELLHVLRARLQAYGTVPDLPGGWHHQSAMLAAHGMAYGGDFLVAGLDEAAARLQLVLVDSCGSGVTAVPDSLRLAGALDSLLATVPPEELLRGANGFLLREPSDESFATAVHLVVDLASGGYRIESAGHPPALRWDSRREVWEIDNARGTALGVSDGPEVEESTGVLGPGDALLFYTDGVVEVRSADIDDGIAWLQETARVAVLEGWEGAAKRIIDLVSRGDDDRAVLMIRRDPEYR